MVELRLTFGWPELVMVALLFPACTGMRMDLAYRKSEVADVIFTRDLLWMTACKSLIACSLRCLGDDLCVTFTLSMATTGGERQCRGHSTRVFSNTEGVAQQGVRFYSLRSRVEATMQGVSANLTGSTVTPVSSTVTTTSLASLQSQNANTTLRDYSSTSSTAKSSAMYSSSAVTTVTHALPNFELCLLSSTCSTAFPSCANWMCVCSPGYYFSYGSGSCVEICALSDLQSEFIEYPNYYIPGYDIYTLTGVTENDCKALCISNVNCRSMEYSSGSRKCSGANVTKLDRPGNWSQSISTHYYQRTCA